MRTLTEKNSGDKTPSSKLMKKVRSKKGKRSGAVSYKMQQSSCNNSDILRDENGKISCISESDDVCSSDSISDSDDESSSDYSLEDSFD